MKRDYVAEVAALRKKYEERNFITDFAKDAVLLLKYSDALYSVLNEYCQNGAWIDDKVNERMAAIPPLKGRKRSRNVE